MYVWKKWQLSETAWSQLSMGSPRHRPDMHIWKVMNNLQKKYCPLPQDCCLTMPLFETISNLPYGPFSPVWLRPGYSVDPLLFRLGSSSPPLVPPCSLPFVPIWHSQEYAQPPQPPNSFSRGWQKTLNWPRIIFRQSYGSNLLKQHNAMLW